MQTTSITVARIYSREKEHNLQNALKFLHDEHRVMGATIIRGIQGFSLDGVMHEVSLVDLSLDLPLILEFFDTPERVKIVLEALETQISHHAVICTEATLLR